jgi:hypothetical protein
MKHHARNYDRFVTSAKLRTIAMRSLTVFELSRYFRIDDGLPKRTLKNEAGLCNFHFQGARIIDNNGRVEVGRGMFMKLMST